MNVLEFKDRYCNLAVNPDVKNDIEHHGIKGQEWDKRRYQNLDGSLTPLGRIHYGVGMSREEMAEAREAEERRQRDIDERRSVSIREMDNDQLRDAVDRSRNEMMFEKNMMDRSANFLNNRNIEERLNMEYEEMQYQQSRLKAERFMGRIERLARFGGNLASAYGKIEEMRGKSAERRTKENIEEQELWKAKQQETKYNESEWNFGKKKSEYEASLKARQAEEAREAKEAKKEAKAEAKAEKKATKEETKKAKDPEYIKKEGDEYVYSDQTKSKWQSFKEKRAAKKEAAAQAKRDALKEEAKRATLGRQVDDSSSLDTYFGGKNNKTSDVFKNKTYDDRSKELYDTSPTWKRMLDNASLRKQEKLKQERIQTSLDNKKRDSYVSPDNIYNTPKAYQSSERNKGDVWQTRMVSQYLTRKNDNSVYNTGNFGTNMPKWSEAMATSPNFNKGQSMSRAALDRAKRRRKGSWNK